MKSFKYILLAGAVALAAIAGEARERSRTVSTQSKAQEKARAKNEKKRLKRQRSEVRLEGKDNGDTFEFRKTGANRYETDLDLEGYAPIKTFSNYQLTDIELCKGKPRIVIEGRDAETVNKYLRLRLRKGEMSWSNTELPRNLEHNDHHIKIYLEEDPGTILNYGIGSIKAESLDTQALNLQTFGVGGIEVKKVDCTSFKAGVSQVGGIKISDLDCTSVYVMTQGVGSVDIKRTDCTSVYVWSQGVGNVDMSYVDGTSVRIVSSGVGNVTMGGDVTSLSVSTQGIGKVNTDGLHATRTTTTN